MHCIHSHLGKTSGSHFPPVWWKRLKIRFLLTSLAWYSNHGHRVPVHPDLEAAVCLYVPSRQVLSPQTSIPLESLKLHIMWSYYSRIDLSIFDITYLTDLCDLILNNILGGWRLIQYKTVILTLNMPSCLTDYQRFIHILYNILDFVQQRTQLKMEQPCMLLILYCQSVSTMSADTLAI